MSSPCVLDTTPADLLVIQLAPKTRLLVLLVTAPPSIALQATHRIVSCIVTRQVALTLALSLSPLQQQVGRANETVSPSHQMSLDNCVVQDTHTVIADTSIISHLVGNGSGPCWPGQARVCTRPRALILQKPRSPEQSEPLSILIRPSMGDEALSWLTSGDGKIA